MLNDKRPLVLMAGGVTLSADQRMWVRGSGNMSLLPDFYMIDIYNLSDDDLSAVREAKTITAYGADNSMICYGEIDDIFTRLEGVNTVTSIAITDGKSFWSAKVNQTVGGGAGFRDALNVIMTGAAVGPWMASETRLPRGQTFSGRLADSVSMLAKSANARAFLTKNVVYVVERGRASDIITIEDSDITGETSYADGVVMLRTKVKGYPIGVIASRNGKKYRLVSQKISADNFKGDWRSDVLLVDEDQVDVFGMEGG